MSIKLIESEAVKSESKTMIGTPVSKSVWSFEKDGFVIRVSMSALPACKPDIYWQVKKEGKITRDGFASTLIGAQRSVNAAINKMSK